MGRPDVFFILATAAGIAVLLGTLLARTARAESHAAFAFAAFLASGASFQLGNLTFAVAFGSLVAPLLFAAAWTVLGRPLPRGFPLWVAAYLTLRFGLHVWGPEAGAHVAALLVEPSLLVVAATAFARGETGRLARQVGCAGFYVMAAADGLGHAAVVVDPANVPELLWIGIGFAGFGLLTVSTLLRERESSRDAIRRLQENVGRFDAIANSAHDLLVEVDEALRVVWASPSVRSVLGFSQDEVIGRDVLSFISSEDLETVTAALGTLAPGGGSEPTPLRVRGKHGEWRRMEGVARLYERGDGQRRIVAVARDVTARVQMEERLRAAQKQESLALLAGGIAHDFNNALMGIVGNVEQMQERVAHDSDLRAWLAEIETAADRATRLTDQLLSYAGSRDLRPQVLDLSAIAGEMVRLTSRRMPDGIQLEAKLGSEVRVRGDGLRIREGVLHLISNAQEALGDSGGRLMLTTGVIDLELDQLGRMECGDGLAPGRYGFLELTDDGIGMTAETRERLFDPFFTTREPGRGLGMANVLGMARNHGAAIEVTTAPGQGTTLRLFFPDAAGESLDLPATPARTDPGGRGSGTILVVDDEEPILRLARRALESRGFTVRSAHNGREAVETFRRHADEIRLVVMDVMMPEMRGDEAFLEIRRYRPGVPVVFSSGWTMDEGLSRIPPEEVAAFLPKPYRHDTLIACVHQALEPDGPRNED